MPAAEPMMPAELAPPPVPTAQEARRSLSSTRMMEASMLSARSAASSSGGLRQKLGLAGVARRTLGIMLLTVTVFLWTTSNFLASYIFSDNTYSKPFFVVYINTSIFAISLIPLTLNYIRLYGVNGLRNAAAEVWREQRRRSRRRWASVNGAAAKAEEEEGHRQNGSGGGGGGGISRSRNSSSSSRSSHDEADPDADDDDNGEDATAGERLLVDDEGSLEAFDRPGFGSRSGGDGEKEERLDFAETAWLSLEFCMLWFLANYLASACLEYTSVGSVTILTSTSSVWTLVFCAVMGVEGFTVRKLLGVLASLAGVVLISSVDLSGKSDENRGNFPHKSQLEVAIGDSMAFVSAIVYGLYVTVMKRRVGNEDRVNMPLFFGLVGLFNLFLLWPVFFILHFTGIEQFALPPSGKVWGIIMLNSLSSFVSDMTWAYAMLLTTPLVVTVGLSLTIPLSLVGEMIQYHQYSSWIYWVGAGVVVLSFLFVNHESQEEEDPHAGRRGSLSASSAA